MHPRSAHLRLAASVFLAALSLTSPLMAQTSSVWTGTAIGRKDTLWSAGKNWQGNAVPILGNHLTFLGPDVDNSNDLAADTSFSGLTFAATAGAFDLTGNRIQLAGNLTNLSAAAQTVTLNLQLATPTSTFMTNIAGNLNVAGVISETGGARSLSKAGLGTLTLSGANTFTGSTTVATAGGTLQLNTVDALKNTSGIAVNTGGTLLLGGAGAVNRVNDSAGVTLSGGTLRISGSSATSETLGVLTQTASSTLDFGSGAGNQLTFAGVGAHTPSASLSILNWSGTPRTAGTATSDRLIFSGTASSFTAAYAQSDVSFSGFGTGYQAIQFEADRYEIAAVPEPATCFGALALVGLIGTRERRRLAAIWQSLRRSS
ncbi:MAG TPA: autotransporter-associated beta strand repeat-containing protein [Chthoniobacteraceae bacterium]